MTDDDILEIARVSSEGYLYYVFSDKSSTETIHDFLFTFARAIAAKAVEKEREACALVAMTTVCDTHTPTGIKIYGTRAAKAIRARGKQ